MAAASPSPNTTGEFETPPTTRQYDAYEVTTYTSTVTTATKSSFGIDAEMAMAASTPAADGNSVASASRGDATSATSTSTRSSSPLVTNVSDQENISPSRPPRARPQSRIISGAELSPLKLVTDRAAAAAAAAAKQHDTNGNRDAVGTVGGNAGVDNVAVAAAPAAPPAAPPAVASVAAVVSPQKQQQPHELQLTNGHHAQAMAAAVRSPRKMSSPDKRFPIKISTSVPVVGAVGGGGGGSGLSPPRVASPVPALAPTTRHSHLHTRQISLDEAVRDNTELKHAIQIFEDEEEEEDAASVLGYGDGADTAGADDNATTTATINAATGANGTGTQLQQQQQQQQALLHKHYLAHLQDDYYEEPAGPDDTMMSTFSTFSAVPNMAMLARFGSQSPAKLGGGSNGAMLPPQTPRAGGGIRAGSDHQHQHQHHYQDDDDGNTTNLLDLTETINLGRLGHGSPSAAARARAMGMDGRPSSPNKRGAANGMSTPGRHQGGAMGIGGPNLLDFDIPPLPTPRSIPTITPRELESLKSGYMSDISSLRASLSGKEAECASLKASLGDAERRAGRGMEQLRGERAQREALEAERDEWQRRGREMEAVLRKVREEIVALGREKEELDARAEEEGRRREAAEQMAQEAESRLAGIRAGQQAAADKGNSPVAAGGGNNREVELAVERVARELHALYKGKHETKVAALKKSYEARWEKRVRETEARAESLARENDELRLGRDATMTKVDPAAEAEKRRKEGEAKEAQAAADAKMSELEAERQRLRAELESTADEGKELRRLLERERVEKGELVLLAEELMAVQQMSASFIGGAPPSAGQHHPPAAAAVGTPSTATRTQTAARRQSTIGTPNKANSSAPMSGFLPGANGPPATAARTTADRLRGSLGRVPTGLRAPVASGAGGESRIGRGPAHERGKSGNGLGGVGIPRPGSGLGLRAGGILSSIEKMGSYGARGV